jgi:hypothetical protein
VRLEYKPAFLPGLNVGFVLNQADLITKDVTQQTFGDILLESVIGAAYENDYFAVRVGYRLDGEADKNEAGVDEGGRLTYRLEGRFLGTMVDGMQVWLNGIYYGLGNEHQAVPRNGKRVEFTSGEYLINWLYWLWDTDSFTAKFNICFGMYQAYLNNAFTPTERMEYQSLEFQPAFYYKFFNNLLQAGVGLGFCMEFGEGKTYKDAPYQYFFVEPQVRLNIGSNAYLALVYNFTEKYVWPYPDPDDPDTLRTGDKSQKHYINLRAVYTF